MRLCFNIDLPEGNLQRVGMVDAQGRLRGSSVRGYADRDLSRFFPVMLCLETLCQINSWHLRRKNFAPLYRSGVFYKEEPPGEEEWLDIPSLYRQGFGDCEDIACARVAELRRSGIPAMPCISWKEIATRKGKRMTLVHVLVLLPDDSIEDPSKVLGMKGSFNDNE